MDKRLLKQVSGDETTGMFCWRSDPWQHAVLAVAEFPDSVIRTVRLNQQADTFFSWPGRAPYKRTTVKCFVTCEDGRIMGHYETSALQEAMAKA